MDRIDAYRRSIGPKPPTPPVPSTASEGARRNGRSEWAVAMQAGAVCGQKNPSDPLDRLVRKATSRSVDPPGVRRLYSKRRAGRGLAGSLQRMAVGGRQRSPLADERRPVACDDCWAFDRLIHSIPTITPIHPIDAQVVVQPGRERWRQQLRSRYVNWSGFGKEWGVGQLGGIG